MSAFSLRSDPFGSRNGTVVQQHTICNGNGTYFTVVDYGATLLGVSTVDASGLQEEVTLNYKNLDAMIANHGPYYGCVAGRVANRIANGSFAVDGVVYSVAVNNGKNHLHGGIEGFDQKVWKATAYIDENRAVAGVRFSYLSMDGEEGYPGNLQVISGLVRS